MPDNAELSEEAMLNAHVKVLPPRAAIGLMIAASLLLWGALAEALTLLF